MPGFIQGLLIDDNASSGGGGGGGSLTVEEVDGSPTVAATKLKFPNGTLSVLGAEATYTPAGGGGGGGAFAYSSTAPGSPTVGDRWVDSDVGILYVYVDDGTSAQWVEF